MQISSLPTNSSLQNTKGSKQDSRNQAFFHILIVVSIMISAYKPCYKTSCMGEANPVGHLEYGRLIPTYVVLYICIIVCCIASSSCSLLYKISSDFENIFFSVFFSMLVLRKSIYLPRYSSVLY